MPRQPLSSQVRSTFPFRRAAEPPNPREKPGLEPGSLDRIGQDGDWLRREIAHALAHGRNVVPLTKGFEFGRDLALPPDVARLPLFNAVPIQPGYFDAAMERLRTRFLKVPSNPTARP